MRRNARLELAVGVSDDAWQAGLEQIQFTIAWHTDRERRVLAARRLEKPVPVGANRWQDITVPLQPVAGQSGMVVLETGAVRGTEPAAAQIFWTPPVVAAESRPDGPNIILISIDTLRADHLGCYHYGRDTSPAIDAMAREGVLFRNAIASSSWTLPSHASLFTGLHPSRHGAVVFGRTSPMPRAVDTLPELLWKNGYDTAGFSGGLFVSADLGFDQGFDRYHDPGYTVLPNAPFWRDVKLAMDWMERRSDRRFFVFLHTYEVHSPYAPPAPYDTMFDPDYNGPYRTRFPDGDYTSVRRTDAVSPRDRYHIEALYDGGIRNMDDTVRKLLAFLRSSKLAENTCIVFTSDHGEEFEEHGNFFHHDARLYEELIRVPMIVWCPLDLPVVESLRSRCRWSTFFPPSWI